MKSNFFTIAAVFLVLTCISCDKEKETVWEPGMPMPKEKIQIGVVHITDPFSENSGYSYAHQTGIEEMQQALDLTDSQILYKVHVDDSVSLHVENAMRELLAQEVNVIFATSWGYMDTCEKLAGEYPSVIFAHASGHKYNDTNFTNYFGKVCQARYLSGIAAGMKTRSNKIGYVAAWGTENSEVTGGLNAFALGVEKVNPSARIYVKVTHSWYDPMGEAMAARALIGEGCDVIAQHCDTPTPQLEVEKAVAQGLTVWGIGYNTDMSADAPATVLTSVIWRWGVYYTGLVQDVINGTFSTAPYFGTLKDGIVDITPLNENIGWDTDQISMLEQERRLIESGTFEVFSGVMETNNGERIGTEGENIPDDVLRNGFDWYYRTVVGN